MNDKLEKATKEDLIDAAYHYLTKPWYKKPTQFISIVGTLAAIITAFTSLYVAFLSQEKARNAINEVKVTGRDITKVASEIAQPLEDIFVYTATYFKNERKMAFEDAKETQEKINEKNLGLTASVYVRDDNNRWAVVIKDPQAKKPMTKDDARNIIDQIKTIGLKGYQNRALHWTQDAMK